MDICLNISSDASPGVTRKVQPSKAAFFKPHVKRLAKKLKLPTKSRSNDVATSESFPSNFSSSPKKNTPKLTRVKQKSLAAIVARNVARSETLNIRKVPKITSVLEKSSAKVDSTLSEASEGRILSRDQVTKPAVSFVKPTSKNVLGTAVAKARNEGKPKRSLSDIFSKKPSETASRRLDEASVPTKEEKSTLAEGFGNRELGERDKNPSRGEKKRSEERTSDKFISRREDKPKKPADHSRPKISSLFGNNPEVPNIGQRLVKPVSESVFGDSTFTDLGVHDFAVSNLRQNMGITTATTVQQRAIPVVLSGKDVLIRSQTGSGKTLSYALPIVERLQSLRPKLTRDSGLRALVVVPTRELALQTYESFVKLVKPFTWIVAGYLVGGEKRKAEKARLRRGCSILVATPGRLLDHIEHTEALRLDQVRCFVLDEADRMLDMGYEKDISGIVEALKRQSGENVRESSYDPLALVRSGGKKIPEEPSEEVILEPEVNNEEEILDDENRGEPEYHSGTESDNDDDEEEFLVRKKKTRKDRLEGEKTEEKTPCEESKVKEDKSTEIPWRQTILLSATLTAAVEKLAGLTMTNPVFVDAARENLTKVGGNLSETNEDLVVPQGVNQSYIVTPAKLRMVTLSAYIAGKCQVAGQHKILVFMATQDMIDYHADILSTVLGKPSDDDDDDSDPLVDVEFFKLHGSMSQKERTEVFKTFRKARSGVLLCTDVASRGLDMPKVDTVIQYTGPLSARDYVHRVGRTARAGTSGVSTIFITPSEIDFVRMLESRRIRIKQENMNDVLDKLVGPLSRHHTVEATATALQNEFETLVLEDKKFYSKACKAYVSWIRFYSSYPRDMREIFNRKDLHLGHYAKSFALRDPPQKIGGIGKTLRDKEPSKEQHNNRLSKERPAKQTQKRANGPGSGQKPGLFKRSRMLNISEYGSGLEPVKKSKQSR